MFGRLVCEMLDSRERAVRIVGFLFAVGVGALACESEREVPNAPEVDGAALAADYSTWSPAATVEQSSPGAHANFNTSSGEGCPFVSRDGKKFFIASTRPGGLGGLDIWVSTRESADDAWGEPVNLGPPVNSSANDFCPTLARDGHTFYFVSTRQVGVQGEDWCGGGDIYATRLRNDQSFDEPRNLGCQVNSAATEFSPFPLSERGSGPVLYFSSTRPGLGDGGDIYRSESHGGVFGPPELVPGINSAFDDGQPNLRRDGLEIFFYSNRPGPGAQGDDDIYVATRASVSDPWSTPVNLGPNVNTPAPDTRPSLSWDAMTLYFGSAGDIYMTTRRRGDPTP
jgi:hypothetical protein